MKKKPSHPMLRKYTVTIEEQIVQEFPVEAYDLSHALETAEAAYKQGELVVQPSLPLKVRPSPIHGHRAGRMRHWHRPHRQVSLSYPQRDVYKRQPQNSP